MSDGTPGDELEKSGAITEVSGLSRSRMYRIAPLGEKTLKVLGLS